MDIEIDGGPIVFMGSMNAMPMMYALELKNKGYDVLYFVDAPVSDKLSRPENHFSDISYPYPEWIVEINIKTQIFLPFFQKFFSRLLEAKIKRKRKKSPQAYIFNGFFIALAPFFPKSAKKIALSHGSDLDSWADIEGAEILSESFHRFSIFKFFPKNIAKKLIKLVVFNQFEGFRAVQNIIYFPYGFNLNGDRVINKLKKHGATLHERYDISFEPLKNQSRAFKEDGDNLVVFSGVRFTYETFSEGNAEYSKGNDLIIQGLAKFYATHKNLLVHFVEKGPDVERAKKLCEETGLAPAVVWHKEMKFTELLDLYSQSDICFDQVGKHWIGAIGGYALWLGKPLIANDKLPVKIGFWPEENPICSASDAEDVYNHLLKLKDEKYRKEVSEDSKKFVEKYMAASKVLTEVFSLKN